jgi:hypothetical protein
MNGSTNRALALALACALGACNVTHKTSGAPAKPPDAGHERDAMIIDASEDAREPSEPDATVRMDASLEAGEPDAEIDTGVDEDDDAGPVEPMVPCEEQLEDSLDGLPEDVECIGLYADVSTKLVMSNLYAFTPAVPLWSDGAGKQRWVSFPEGEKIDATDLNNWVFPIGTRFFKEFRVDGRRVETRIFMKVRADRWVAGTYAWNEDESGAKRSQGEDKDDVLIAGTKYHIPTARECEQCHGGRRDRVLGFEAISLGLEGAAGLTLERLVEEDLIAPAPERTKLAIGDDGTGHAADVLPYLHINCGVPCHNSNPNADAYSSTLFMKLDAEQLDGRSATQLQPMQLLVDQDAKTMRWGDRKRIVPGSPEDSLLFQLITSRAGPQEQMPPIATKVVDGTQVEHIRAWINALNQ